MLKRSGHKVSLGHKLSHRLHVNEPFPDLLLTMEEDGGLVLGWRLQRTAERTKTKTLSSVKGHKFSTIKQRMQKKIDFFFFFKRMTEHLVLAGLDTGGGGAGGMGSGTLGTSSVSAVLTGAARASAELLLVFSGAL